MSYYNIQEFSNLYGTYPQYASYQGPQYAQPFSSSEDTGTVERGKYPIQDFPPALIDFWNLDDSFLASIVPSSSVARASANLPTTLLQNSLSGMLSYSDLDTLANGSRNLAVAAPVPVPHAARTKAAIRTMMSFGDEDKEDTHDSSTAGVESLKMTDARTQVDSDDYVLHPDFQTAIDYNALATAGHNKQNTTGRSKVVIRSISPSTLMALTEPCLMSWCTALGETLAEPGSSPYLPLKSSDYIDYIDAKNNAVYNAWGY